MYLDSTPRTRDTIKDYNSLMNEVNNYEKDNHHYNGDVCTYPDCLSG